ncbi:hypothetical protein [Pontibacter sp. SGAir0037]|uniref:hypothetical protein n=1 Tax=Pontibacter sp. SGAir0037 TaxID=2571030 RepID=UPI0010CD280F|nr:hypothetical protein [Pontibacter sp. SGAir0037]QCR22150.1 hypothetical protein C1N53_07220 [Pontibacter sp. SGAir0037]
MEDFKVIFYILLAVGYFLFTVWRKAFKSADENTPPDNVPQRRRQEPAAETRPRPQQPIQPSTSYEDILRELKPKAERAKEHGRELVNNFPAPAARPEPVAEEVFTTEKLKPRVLSWEKPAEAREAAKRSMEIRNRKSNAGSPKQAAPQSSYAKMLRSPNGMRDAVILSEILKRKF